MKKYDFDLGIFKGKIYVEGVFKNASIGIKKNKIAHIGELTPEKCLQSVEFENKYILPGMIDTQVHFREPGLTHKEDIYHGTKGALLGGITSIFEMPNTSPATINEKELNKKIKIAEKSSWANFAFFMGACKSNVSKLNELEKMKGCAGVKIFMGSSTGSLLISEEEDLKIALKTCKRRVAIHSEDEQRLVSRFQRINKSNGVREHEKWRDPLSAIISTKKVLKHAKKYNTKAHILHISTDDEIKLLKNKGKHITSEVTPQHLTLFSPDCYHKLGSLAQMNPPIRSLKHQLGLWEGINNGTVDVIGSDHAPHTIEEKNKEWPNSPSGMPGVQTTLSIMLNHVNNKKLTLQKLIQLLSENPCKIYNIKNKGFIKKGYDADLTVVDLKRETIIKNEDILSKSGWSPYNGMKLKGIPFATIINGSVKMIDGKVFGKPNGKTIDFN